MKLMPDWKTLFFTYICPRFYGGAPAAPANTTSTVTQNTIPDWLRGPVLDMLGSARSQVFNADGSVRQYQPYSTNPADYVAPFSPLQQQSYDAAAGLKLPGQYADATKGTRAAGQGMYNTAGQAYNMGLQGVAAGNQYGQQATNANAVQAYMNPYVQASLDPQLKLMNQQSQIQQAQNNAQAVGQGAFGGNRAAVLQGLTQQNNALAQQQAIGQGYNTAYNTAQQAMQEAGRQRMQGIGYGLQGIQGAQAGYLGQGQMAGQLADIGGKQFATQQGIINLQNQMGQQQTARQQDIINNAINNYAMQQQYPMQRLADYNALIRGYASGNTTRNYQAAPSGGSQLAGLLGTGLSAYQLARGKEGGIVGLAGGGSIGHAIKHLADPTEYPVMDSPAAQQSSTLPQGLKALLQEKQAVDQQQAQQAKEMQQPKPPTVAEQVHQQLTHTQGVAGVPSNIQGFAPGGIIAFAEGGSPEEDSDYGEAPLPIKKGRSHTQYGLAGLLEGANAKAGLPPGLMTNIARVESGMNPNATNPNSSASGIMQMTKDTWRDWADDPNASVFDPVAHAGAAANKLKADLAKSNGDVHDTIARWMLGSNASDKQLNSPEANAYVDKVLAADGSKDYGAVIGGPRSGSQQTNNYQPVNYVDLPEPETLPTDAAAMAAEAAKLYGEDPNQVKRETRMDKAEAGLDKQRQQALWMALLEGSLKTLGGQSPFGLVNVGEGGVAGLQAYREGQKAINEQQAAQDERRNAEEDAQRAEHKIPITYGINTSQANRLANIESKQNFAKNKLGLMGLISNMNYQNKSLGLQGQELDYKKDVLASQPLPESPQAKRVNENIRQLTELIKTTQAALDSMSTDEAKKPQLQLELDNYNQQLKDAMAEQRAYAGLPPYQAKEVPPPPSSGMSPERRSQFQVVR